MNAVEKSLKIVEIIDKDLEEHTDLWRGLDQRTRASIKLRWMSKLISVVGGA
jgi:hypothetical protein